MTSNEGIVVPNLRATYTFHVLVIRVHRIVCGKVPIAVAILSLKRIMDEST